MTSSSRRDPLTRSAFVLCLLAITLGGLGIRLGMVVFADEPSEPGFLVNYDPIFYHRQANLLADGRGFIAPYRLDAGGRGVVTPSAGHPPLLSVVLAGASTVGLDGFKDHRGISAILGALAVPLVGLLGAQLARRKVGLVAAGLAAVYPNLWANDGLIMSESLYAVLIVGALILSYRFWRTRSMVVAAALGATIGLAALTRGEGLLLLGLLVVPVVWFAPDGATRPRVAGLAAAAAACALVLAPWTVHNLARFEEPVLISTAADGTFAGANCDTTYDGSAIGYWTDACYANIDPDLEESVRARRMRSQAVRYVRGHLDRLPAVGAARLGRLWDVYQPEKNVDANELQNRPRPVAWLGLFSFYPLVALSIIGAFGLRRRSQTVIPFVAMVALVSLTGLLFYGNVRFRIPVEISLVVLAAVALVDLAERITGRSSTSGGRA